MQYKKILAKSFGTVNNVKKQILKDYSVIFSSRRCSILGRREVLGGKGKFGIFGDGKELPQVVMSRFFKKGDFRSGYYRDQTLMFSLGLINISTFFASLYGFPDIKKEPMSGGRQMIGHYVSESINTEGYWNNLTEQMNTASDISPTAGQIPRLIGLAQASKLYRKLPIKNKNNFSNNGDEIAWGTIGNASTSEGIFLESINAAGVMQIPMVLSIWDDDYGISVHNDLHTTKSSISEALKGFQRTEKEQGIEIFKVKGWDYLSLIETYYKASKLAREKHIPVLIHVVELTQPSGHSTSGSHERYKSKERLVWEQENDCNKKMRQWIIDNEIATDQELIAIENEINQDIIKIKRESWVAYQAPIFSLRKELSAFIDIFLKQTNNDVAIQKLKSQLLSIEDPFYKDIISVARRLLRSVVLYKDISKDKFQQWLENLQKIMRLKYNSKLYSDTPKNLDNVTAIFPKIDKDSEKVDGRVIIRDNFNVLLEKYDNLIIFGEDVGVIGDVNQGLEGLQKKYGSDRVADTSIREATIIGQGIGLALRGFRPIAEIQYVDYVLYAMSILSDDLACYSYRTMRKQIVPLIIRTRGHRLEGIWHSGSPMGGITHFMRGVNILVPRNMTQAAGFYNTLLKGDEPALVVESLNGYRIKENKPKNLGEYRVPVGVVEVLKAGKDITLVSYGSTLRIVMEVAKNLEQYSISSEVIDIQSLVPFDKQKNIVKSVSKTNRILIIDEDVPGGASGYILQQLIDNQNIYQYLDSPPQTLSAQAHRPAYGSDGDYFSKPSDDDIFEKVLCDF